MASLPAAEDEYDFIEKPSEDFYCPVTLDLLREPHQMLCCGNHLSPEAVTRLQGQPCPVCKETNLNTVPDKFFKRKVNELKVRCPNKSLGCEWVGELCSLDRHLSQNSVEGECQFVTVACPHSCCDSFQRRQLKGHKANVCPNRPFTCQYCDHRATYITVTSEHWPICTKYPVDCPNKSLGCQWAGERGDLDQHLNGGSEEGECQFVTVVCPYDCGDSFQRCQLEGHKANDCPRRPFTCQYCDHKATYIAVTNEHWPICKQYPLECPNKCGEDAIERQHLPKHLQKTCPLQVIKCRFSYAGCEVESQRQHMQTHLEENVRVHLSKVSCRTKQQRSQINALQHRIEQQEQELEKYKGQTDCKLEKQQSMNEQQQKQIVALMSALQRVALDMKKPLAPVFVPLPDIVMTDFEKHKKADESWYSSPFYSHIGGYKMCLGVYANGYGNSKDTHVSVFVYLMRGEYDDQLKWPFRGDITIQLLNQSRDEGHWEKTVYFDDRADNEAGTVVGQKGGTGWGYKQFIAHTNLNTENKEYLKNNCLKFRISKIVVTST